MTHHFLGVHPCTSVLLKCRRWQDLPTVGKEKSQFVIGRSTTRLDTECAKMTTLENPGGASFAARSSIRVSVDVSTHPLARRPWIDAYSWREKPQPNVGGLSHPTLTIVRSSLIGSILSAWSAILRPKFVLHHSDVGRLRRIGSR